MTMNNTSDSDLIDGTILPFNSIDKMAKKILIATLKKLTDGNLILIDAEDNYTFGNANTQGLHATLTVKDPSFYRDILLGGSLGASEAFLAAKWQVDNLVDLIRIFLCNKAILEQVDQSVFNPLRWISKLLHWRNKNSVAGSKRNILAHYDLGNDFFSRFLDDSMMYSCALFKEPSMSLAQASIAKIKHICDKLALTAKDRLLEIGSGWGSFAIYAAQHYGCHVTTTTISNQQYAYVEQRIQQLGLTDKITLLKSDYRDLTGQYDKLVSIEMIEAVGHHYYKDYFKKCAELLTAEGIALIQSITIADQAYKSARDEVDFIKRYVFPGGCLPAVSTFTDFTRDYTDLKLIHLEDIGPHYAMTLAHWRSALMQHSEEIIMQFSAEFLRLWQYYFCYCEAGFLERYISNVQVILAKPQYRGQLLIEATPLHVTS